MYNIKRKGIYIMQFVNFLFDLDGTLSDPQKGIIYSMQYALKSFGIDEEYEKLKKYIGPPLYSMFAEYLPEEKIDEAIAKYRERYSVTGIYENEMYDGILKVLQSIKKNGGKVFLATSKPQEYATEILKYFCIDEYFDSIAGSSMNNNHETKKDVIEKIFLQNDIDKESSVMIGDREHDIIGAKQAGIDAVGVLYGFGDTTELETQGPLYIADTVEKLNAWILQSMKRGVM